MPIAKYVQQSGWMTLHGDSQKIVALLHQLHGCTEILILELLLPQVQVHVAQVYH